MEQTDNTNKKTFITYLEITLVVLFLITLGYFIFNKNNNNVDTHKNQIDSLNTDISKSNKKIDSIKLLNTKVTFSIDSINKKVSDNEYELFKTKNELDNLKKQFLLNTCKEDKSFATQFTQTQIFHSYCEEIISKQINCSDQ